MRKLSVVLWLPIFASQLMAQQRPVMQQSSLAFTHVTVIDMTGAPPKPEMTVVVTGNRITVARVAPSTGAAGRVLVGNLPLLDGAERV
jgi:hypothetical protein